MPIVRYPVILTALSPISHGSEERAGNDSLFRRQALDVGGQRVEVPMLSGNAIRGRLRRVAGERYCQLAGLGERSIPLNVFHAIFAGGSIAKGEESGRMGIADKRALRDNCPPLSLLGTAWRADIMQGKLTVGMAYPICAETEQFTGTHESRSIHEFVDEFPQSRKDDRESKWIAEDVAPAAEEAAEDKDDGQGETEAGTLTELNAQKELDFFDAVDELNEPAKPAPATDAPKPSDDTRKLALPRKPKAKKSSVQMLYRTEVLIPGTRFASFFLLDDANPVEIACFFDTIQTWLQNPTLGGKASGGYGRFQIDFARGTEDMGGTAPYIHHMRDNATTIREWLAAQGVRL